MKIRLMLQACGCSTVRGGGGLKVRARLCHWHSRWQSACRLRPSTYNCRWFGFATEAAMKLRF